MLWDTADPDRFVEVIEYVDRATHDRDQQRVDTEPEMVEYLRRWRDLLAESAQVETYEVDTPARASE